MEMIVLPPLIKSEPHGLCQNIKIYRLQLIIVNRL